MGDAKLYAAEDIEKLKQKIAAYRDTLTTLKMEGSIDEDLFMKGEFTNVTAPVSISKELMEVTSDKQSIQMEGSEQRIQKISVEIDDLSQTVKELNEELSSILTKFKQSESSDVIEKTDTSTDVQSSVSVNDKHIEQKTTIIEEMDPPEEGTSTIVIQQSNHLPSYKQLQGLVGRSDMGWGIPTSTAPAESIDFREELEEQRDLDKKSFPATTNHPNQLYNGRYRNKLMKSTAHLNKVVRTQAVPAMVNAVVEQPVPPMANEVEEIEKVVEHTHPHYDSPVIEKEERAVEKEVEIEVRNEQAPEMALIEMPSRMKQREDKNKETLSLFNFFRRGK